MSSSLRPLLFVPVLMGAALVVGGFASGSDVMVGIGFGLAGSAFVIFLGLNLADASGARAERRRIWKGGRPAVARVMAIAETAGGGEGDPEVDLDLDLRLDGAPSRRVKVRTLISRLAVPRLQPGCEIQVRVDPAGADKVVIDPGLTPYRVD